MPSRCISSLSCWKPSATSPRATSEPTGTPGRRLHRALAHCVGDAPALEQLQQRGAARAGGVADGGRGQHGRRTASSLPMSGRGRARLHGHGHARAHEVDPAAAPAHGRRRPACRSRRRRGPRRRTASPACTRLAASTPPTDSIAAPAPPARAARRTRGRPAPGAWPSRKCRAGASSCGAPVSMRRFWRHAAPAQSHCRRYQLEQARIAAPVHLHFGHGPPAARVLRARGRTRQLHARRDRARRRPARAQPAGAPARGRAAPDPAGAQRPRRGAHRGRQDAAGARPRHPAPGAAGRATTWAACAAACRAGSRSACPAAWPAC